MSLPNPANPTINTPRRKPAKKAVQSPGVAPRSPSPDRLGLHAPQAGISKADVVIAMLRQPQGTSVDEIMAATGWQRHSVRGALSGTVKKRLGAAVTSEIVDGVRRYRAPESVA